MSYPRELDEYDEEQLAAELALRRSRRDRGLCDYCGRISEQPPCRFVDRHEARRRNEGVAVATGEATPGEWRTGHSVGRTIYVGETLIGTMDRREDAALVVHFINASRAAKAAVVA